jgi:hypothetical protein
MKIIIERKDKMVSTLKQTLLLEMINTAEIRLIATDITNNKTEIIVNFTELYQAINTIATENQNQ